MDGAVHATTARKLPVSGIYDRVYWNFRDVADTQFD